MIVQDNSIYVTSDEKYISMIERKNGAIGWHISLSERLTSHLAVTDAAVYYSTNQNHLFAINASSGTVLWQKTLPGLSSGPLDLNQLYVSGNILIYLDDNSTLHTANLQALALRTDTGSILWRNNLDGWAVNSATLYHNSIDILTENGTVAAYDIQSGKRQWQVTFNGNYPSYISLDKDTLIARSANGTSFILDAQNGSILHQYQIPMATYSAIIENGKAYVNPGKDPQNAGIVSYDVNNGMVLWRYHLIVPLSSPTFSDQKILVNDFLGNTYILSAANGSLLKILQNT
jgi:outer membrane protein assembly factor BamB